VLIEYLIAGFALFDCCSGAGLGPAQVFHRARRIAGGFPDDEMGVDFVFAMGHSAFHMGAQSRDCGRANSRRDIWIEVRGGIVTLAM